MTQNLDIRKVCIIRSRDLFGRTIVIQAEQDDTYPWGQKTTNGLTLNIFDQKNNRFFNDIYFSKDAIKQLVQFLNITEKGEI